MAAFTLSAERSAARALDALGPAGTVGLGVSAFCAVFYFGTLEPALGELHGLEQHRAKLEAAAPERRSDAISVAQKLGLFYERLPRASESERVAEQIFSIGNKFGVALRQGSYRYVKEQGAPLGRYEITYTAIAEYYRVRLMLRELQKEMPALALDDIAFQRQQASAPAPEVTLKVSLYARPG